MILLHDRRLRVGVMLDMAPGMACEFAFGRQIAIAIRRVGAEPVAEE